VDRLLETNLQLDLWNNAVPRAACRVPRSEGTDHLEEGGLPIRGTRNAERGTYLQSAIDRIRTRWGTRGVRLGA